MALSQERSLRKPTGGRYRDYRKKRMFNLGEQPTNTKVGEKRLKVKREMGGNIKNTLLSTNKINVILDKKTKKSQIAEIKTVVDNPANRNFIRMNIITKGTILETNVGKVKVTSRPGQEGTLNGILVSQ